MALARYTVTLEVDVEAGAFDPSPHAIAERLVRLNHDDWLVRRAGVIEDSTGAEAEALSPYGVRS